MAFNRLFAFADDLNDGRTDVAIVNVHHRERLRGDAFTFGDQAEQKVLSPDVVVLEPARFILREDDDAPSSVGKPFEHVIPFVSGDRANARSDSSTETTLSERTIICALVRHGVKKEYRRG
ncbi:Uncharacterised protein [Chlamydia trachomatis]|nr:Uncharacterised protein [Chlamydia trachomatis]